MKKTKNNQKEDERRRAEEASNTLSIVDTMINDTLVVTVGGDSQVFIMRIPFGEDLSNQDSIIFPIADYQASSSIMTSSEDVVQEKRK